MSTATAYTHNEDTIPTGGSRRALAAAAAQIHGYVLTGEARDFEAELPWLSAVGVVLAYDAGSAGEGIQVTFRELAAALRKGYQRTAGEEDEAGFDAVPPLAQLAWEAVARLLAWAVQSEEATDEGLSAGLNQIGQWADNQLAPRGIRR